MNYSPIPQTPKSPSAKFIDYSRGPHVKVGKKHALLKRNS